MATAEEAATWQQIQELHIVLSPVSVPSSQQWLHQQGLRAPQCNNDNKRPRGFVLSEGVSWETGIEDGDQYLSCVSKLLNITVIVSLSLQIITTNATNYAQ